MNLRYLSYLLYIVLMITGVNAYAAETLEPVAKKGQVIVIYRGPCPSGKTKAATRKIEKIISYERKNSPVSYSSSPGNWEDGQVGAVDLHASQSAMEKALLGKSQIKNGRKCTMTLQKFAAPQLKNFMCICLLQTRQIY